MFELQVEKEQYNAIHVLMSSNLLHTPLGVRSSSSLLAFRFTVYLSERRDNTYRVIEREKKKKERKKERRKKSKHRTSEHREWKMGSTTGVRENSGSIAVAIGTNTGTGIEMRAKGGGIVIHAQRLGSGSKKKSVYACLRRPRRQQPPPPRPLLPGWEKRCVEGM